MSLGLGLGLRLTSRGASRGRGQPFHPIDLFANGERGYFYDLTDLSTMFQESDGETPAAVGQPVGLHLDGSGNGNHRRQAAEECRPVLIEGGLSPDGTNDFLVTDSIDLSHTQAVTVAGGYQAAQNAVEVLQEFSPSFNGNEGGFALYAQMSLWAANGRGSGTPGDMARSTIAQEIGEPVFLLATLDIGASSNRISKDGSPADAATGAQGTGNRGTYPIFFHARAGEQFFFNGLVLDHEFMIDRLLTPDELAQYEAWAMERIHG